MKLTAYAQLVCQTKLFFVTFFSWFSILLAYPLIRHRKHIARDGTFD